MHVYAEKGPWSLFPVPSTRSTMETTSINPAIPHSTGSQIMQNRSTPCVCVCVFKDWAGTEHIPVVLIESCVVDCKKEEPRIDSFTHLHTLIYPQLDSSYTLKNTRSHPTPEERCYWIETVRRPLSHRPVWSLDELALPLSLIICVCGLNAAHKGNKICCLSAWNQNRWSEI